MKARWLLIATSCLPLACDDDPVAPPTGPTAAFEVTPGFGWTDTEFQVDASACSDPGDPDSTLSVRWDWEDDGIWDTAWSRTKTAAHRYGTEGTKKIRLEVQDPSQQTAQATNSVSVTLNEAPETVISGWEPDMSTGFAARIHWTGSDADGTVQSYRIGWDPGALAAVAVEESLLSLIPGTNTFYVAAVDNEGREDATPAMLAFDVPTSLLSTPEAIIQSLSLSYRWRDSSLFNPILADDPSRNAAFFFLLSEPTGTGETSWGHTEEVRIHQRMFHPESPQPGDPPVPAELWPGGITITLTQLEEFGERTDLYSQNGGLDGKLDPAIWRARDAVYRHYILFDLVGTDYLVEGRSNFVTVEDLTKEIGDPGRCLLWIWEDLGSTPLSSALAGAEQDSWSGVKGLYR